MSRHPDDQSSNLGDRNSPSIFDLDSEEISFLDQSMNCCVCFVDILNSTKFTSEIFEPRRIRQYYSIFINTMALLARNHKAKIVKNAGDALIFYFPQTSDSSNETAFKNVLECLTAMISTRDIINSKLSSENLPAVSYRISADYGQVEVATSTSSKREDLFGSTMNICAKINSMAEPNGIVIGGDVYQILKSFSFINRYKFKELPGYPVGFSHNYPIYRFWSKSNTCSSNSNTNSQLGHGQAKQQLDMLKQSQQERQEQQGPRQPANIMLVDDEPDILFTYESFLSSEGYNVQAFSDPREALKHFIQLSNPSSHYKLILLDIRMAKLNGLQLFSKIKRISTNTKVIFVSALDIAEELVSIFPDVRYDDIIKKPVEKELFVSKIKSAISAQ
jgi:two-component system response regulator ChvI